MQAPLVLMGVPGAFQAMQSPQAACELTKFARKLLALMVSATAGVEASAKHTVSKMLGGGVEVAQGILYHMVTSYHE